MDSVISVLSTIGVIFIVVMLFNFMIFIHELGHFWAARWRGLYVDRFQIWFGKPIWKKKINGVQWGLGWIPAGGFVSLPQMAPMEAIEGEVDLPEDLKPVSPLDKIIVAAAGPLASLALAFVFALAVWVVGKPDVEMLNTTVGYLPEGSAAAAAGLLPGDKILEIDGHPVDRWAGDMVGVSERIMLGERDTIDFLVQRPGVTEPVLISSGFKIPETKWWQRKAMRQAGVIPAMDSVVTFVFPGSPAEKAGLQKDDVILKLNGEKLWSPSAIQAASKEGKTMRLDVRHKNGEEFTTELTPAVPENWKGLENAQAHPGVDFSVESLGRRVTLYPTPIEQVSQSLRWMKDTILKVVAPKSDVGMQHLSGPVGIANHFYQLFVIDEGWKLVLWFAVFLNVNLAILNMLPMPVVDGGHVVLNTLELIFKRPVGGKILEFIQVGFVFVILSFFLFVTFKDVGDLFGPRKQKLPIPVFKVVE